MCTVSENRLVGEFGVIIFSVLKVFTCVCFFDLRNIVVLECCLFIEGETREEARAYMYVRVQVNALCT